jgi:peptidoglycan DL-endopeptidase CwlO
MLARKFALATALAASASLVISIGPATMSATAEEVPPPAVTQPTPAPTTSTSPTPAPTTTTPTPSPTTTTPAPPKKLTKAQKARAKAKAKAKKARAKANKVIKAALSKVRRGQYVRGRSGPNSFDCSGLMIYAFRKIGVKLPHSSRAQSTRPGKKISKKNLKPGDLVFYYSPVHHVALYIGNGKIVHARNPRADLDITKLSKYPHFRWGRRVIR